MWWRRHDEYQGLSEVAVVRARLEEESHADRIIGAGAIGGTLARRLAKRGHQVSMRTREDRRAWPRWRPRWRDAVSVSTPPTPEDRDHLDPTKAVADLPRIYLQTAEQRRRDRYRQLPPGAARWRIDAIDRGMLDSQWVAHRLGVL